MPSTNFRSQTDDNIVGKTGHRRSLFNHLTAVNNRFQACLIQNDIQTTCKQTINEATSNDKFSSDNIWTFLFKVRSVTV